MILLFCTFEFFKLFLLLQTFLFLSPLCSYFLLPSCSYYLFAILSTFSHVPAFCINSFCVCSFSTFSILTFILFDYSVPLFCSSLLLFVPLFFFLLSLGTLVYFSLGLFLLPFLSFFFCFSPFFFSLACSQSLSAMAVAFLHLRFSHFKC